MKTPILATLLLATTLSVPALAQGSSNAASAPPSGSSGQTAVAQKIQDDLKKAGFTDINVVAESFVVQAKTKDGNPVVMTIGPHGMSVFEAMTTASPGASAHSQGTASSSASNNNSTSKNSSSASHK